MFKNKTLLIILSFRSVILYQHVDDNYQHASYLNNKHPHMSRSLSLIFNLKVTCRLCLMKISHHHKPYMINHIVTRGKEVSSQMTISAVIFGMKSFNFELKKCVRAQGI